MKKIIKILGNLPVYSILFKNSDGLYEYYEDGMNYDLEESFLDQKENQTTEDFLIELSKALDIKL